MDDRRLVEPLNLVASSVSVDGDLVRISNGEIEIRERKAEGAELNERLAQLIYVHLYSRSPRASSKPDGPRSIMSELLSAVPRTRDVDWDWAIRTRHQKGSVIVSCGNRIAEVPAGEYLFAPGDRNEHGESHAGLLKWSVRYNDESDWLLIRHRMPGVNRGNREVRIYFNAFAAGALKVVSTVVEKLAGWDIPFALKCHTQTGNYRRRDAVILYLDRRDSYVALELISGDYSSIAGCLAPDVPLFTRFFMPGIAFAETPEDGGSFGLSRARLCANALTRGDGGPDTPNDRLQILEAAFRDAGLSTMEPFRNPGDFFEYDDALIRSLAGNARC